MANPNPDPLKARQAKKAKRRGKPGSLSDAQAVLWQALRKAGELLEHEDPHLSLKAVHAVSQCAANYAKVLEVGELEARLQALEAEVEAGRGRRPRSDTQRQAGRSVTGRRGRLAKLEAARKPGTGPLFRVWEAHPDGGYVCRKTGERRPPFQGNEGCTVFTEVGDPPKVLLGVDGDAL